MTVGEYTYGARNIKQNFQNKDAKLTIGKYCSIANNINIWLGGNHNSKYISTYPFGLVNRDKFKFVCPNQPSTNGDVKIGNDVLGV